MTEIKENKNLSEVGFGATPPNEDHNTRTLMMFKIGCALAPHFSAGKRTSAQMNFGIRQDYSQTLCRSP